MLLFEDAFGKFKLNPASRLDWRSRETKKRSAEVGRKGLSIGALIKRFFATSGMVVAGLIGVASVAAPAAANNLQTSVLESSFSASAASTGSLDPAEILANRVSFDIHVRDINNKLSIREPYNVQSGLDSFIPIIEKNDDSLLKTSEVLSELGKSVYDLIGVHGVARLRQFARLHDGWDEGGGLAMSAESLRAFHIFFSQGTFKPLKMGVFMSSDGNVIANWLVEEFVVELEFQKDGIFYYNEKSSDEHLVPNFRTGELRDFLIRNALNSGVEVG